MNFIGFKLKKKIESKISFLMIFLIYYYNHYFAILSYQFKFKKNNDVGPSYYTAKPNLGAGIGHQIANWISGYWFAKQFGLKYAHSPFSTYEWDKFLGFGENELKVNELLRIGYKIVRLPLFDETNTCSVENQKKIISSYNNRKVLFIAEQDQGYKDQFGVAEILQEKFFNAPYRIHNRLIFDTKFLNISIHIRRGDIVVGQENQNPNLLFRWQKNEYFINVLRKVLANFKSPRPIAIYLFSQGKVGDFMEFKQFDNINFCLDLNPMDSFLHMVYADILITSKSSFSYKPALLNKGIKVCPKDFWHGYPNNDNWFLADESGFILNDFVQIDN